MVGVLSKEDYIKEANQQLTESVYYRKLSTDPTSQYTAEVKYVWTWCIEESW